MSLDKAKMKDLLYESIGGYFYKFNREGNNKQYDVSIIGNELRIMILYKEVLLRDTIGNQHLIRDLLVRLRFNIKFSGKKLVLKINSPEGMRMTKSVLEYKSYYNHSHLNTGAFPTDFNTFCLGSGSNVHLVYSELNDDFAAFAANNKKESEIFEYYVERIHEFIILLERLIYYESSNTSPYIKIRNIAVNESVLGARINHENYDISSSSYYDNSYIKLFFILLKVYKQEALSLLHIESAGQGIKIDYESLISFVNYCLNQDENSELRDDFFTCYYNEPKHEYFLKRNNRSLNLDSEAWRISKLPGVRFNSKEIKFKLDIEEYKKRNEELKNATLSVSPVIMKRVAYEIEKIINKSICQSKILADILQKNQ